jgi:hypothetical protein
MRQTTTALVAAAHGARSGDVEAITLLAQLSNRLREYTGRIDTARANNRAGNPVGVAYLSEASELMRGSILPLAERLYITQSRSVAATQTATARPPVLPVVICTSVLLALIAPQFYLTRLSRRRINPGPAVASLLMAALAIWLLAAGVMSSAASDHARKQGTQPLRTMVAARIHAQQARVDETWRCCVGDRTPRRKRTTAATPPRCPTHSSSTGSNYGAPPPSRSSAPPCGHSTAD